MSDARAAFEELAGRPPLEVDTDIFELSAPLGGAHYDRIARLYDVALSTNLYNRVMWKSSPARYRAFAASVFESRSTGLHVELGCGSLLFTSQLYDQNRGRPVILIDQSIEMLRLARARLARRTGEVPPHVLLARGDVRRLGVAAGQATTVLSMFVLHVVDEPQPLLLTLDDVARSTESTVGLTSLFLSGGRGDSFLRLLHRAGELSVPRSRAAIEALVAETISGQASVETDGSVSFIAVTR
jgi:SAM-dependent methyltransferase